ncbi:phosphonate C-P lyase system protein PhnG [Conexibacter sp. JD483]|uniref:phosphonate C-P lyase system protein PhnG n=1 Tax=unclassified Conexibacter TaxID=2627773 RepID=UPI0027224869|nr:MULTISPECIES: phosphonate C-P lyase system protein PhnG [unclassified Conexibacter]MDO8189045.1 phosphonate C-P lyase system protein PhnG [Conexibacter sp. CPCC 205706]MDO8198514.1 phosphonate C-P lyase system protein PhnG [Conexibacter sp. CPCC 205762]MDR9367600.1 phosphonate C-P lyase system protein PhnG [Conexibacter sp. JD483]
MSGLTIEELHELIAHGRIERLEAATQAAVGELDVSVTAPAEPALTLLRVRDAVAGAAFNAGEVLVTRCELELEGVPGWSTVVGDERRRALCGALLDAAARRGALAGVEADLAAELLRCRAARAQRWAAVQPTRVEFEEMAQ